MKDAASCQYKSCFWTYRYELLGLIFLAIATILTLVTHNGFGIMGMFFVGFLLCARPYWSCLCACHRGETCHPKCATDATMCAPGVKVTSTEEPHAKKKA